MIKRLLAVAALGCVFLAAPARAFFETWLRYPMIIKGGEPVYPPDLAKANPQGEIVTVGFDVDYHGNVGLVRVKHASGPRVVAAVTRAVEGWKFEPALAGGGAAECVEDNWIVAIGRPAKIGDFYLVYALDRMPMPVRITEPKSSKVKHDSEVFFTGVIDQSGMVQDLVVARAERPNAVAPAVAAIIDWRFTPGIKDGKIVPAFCYLPVNVPGSGYWIASENWKIPPSAKDAPPEFRYDCPPTPWLSGAGIYPYDLLVNGVTGSATIAFAIDPTGFVQRTTVAEASNPEFGEAAAAEVATWRFEPAYDSQAEKTRWAVLKIKQVFSPDDQYVALDKSGDRLLKMLTTTPAPTFPKVADLDAMPVLRYQLRPVIPQDVRQAGLPASALIEIIIDRFGHAQFPRIVSTTNQAYGWAAATAIGRWQFTVPTKNGVPVDAIADIPSQYVPPGKK